MKKKVVIGLLVMAMVTSAFSACGSEQKGSQKKQEVEEDKYMYLGEYSEFTELGENTYISSGPMIKEDKAYYIVGSYSEEDQLSTYQWCVNDLGSGELKKTDIQVGKTEYISRMILGEDDNFYMLRIDYGEDNQFLAETSFCLEQCTEDGSKVKDWNLTELLQLENSYVDQVCVPEEGIAYLAFDEKMVAVDLNQSKQLFQLDTGYVEEMCSGAGGVYFSSWMDGLQIQHVSTKEQKVDQTFQKIKVDSVNHMYLADEDTLLISTGNSVEQVNLKDESTQQVLNWMDADIDSDNVRLFEVKDNGDVFVILEYYEDKKVSCEKGLLKKTEVTPENQKVILTYGTENLGYAEKKNILRFNRTNEKYRIRVKEYAKDSEEGENIGEKLMNEITSGNAPDILDVRELDLSNLAKKGVLVDMNPLFEEDAEIHREDYYENAFEAGSVDGKLYAIFPKVTFSSLVAKKSVVGDTANWTTKELEQCIEKRPENTDVLEYATKMNALEMFLTYNKNQYIDWQNGTCNFDSDEFCAMMNMCNEFPLENNYDSENDSLPKRIQSDKMLIWGAEISEASEVQVQNKLAGGEEIVWMGYPCGGSMKPILNPCECAFAITSNCVDQNAAWSFISMSLKDKAQEDNSYGWGFPIKKTALDQLLAKNMEKDYYTDENGEKVEMQKGGYGYEDGTTIEVYAITQEEADTIKQLMENAVGISGYDQKLMNIVEEEAQAFFSGQKTLAETVSVIQSRASLYINESL